MTDITTPTEHTEPLSATGRIYVLRVWHEPSGGAPVWRAAIRATHLTERTYFATVDACLEHLYRELARR